MGGDAVGGATGVTAGGVVCGGGNDGIGPGLVDGGGVIGGAISLSTGMATRPRHSASRPTAIHAANTGTSQSFPLRALKRCCASQRNSLAPARQPANPT